MLAVNHLFVKPSWSPCIRSASTQWTPRVHRLIVKDRSKAEHLAALSAHYVYALIAIILRNWGVADDTAVPFCPLFMQTCDRLDRYCAQPDRWCFICQSFGSPDRHVPSGRKNSAACLPESVQNPCLGANELTGDIFPKVPNRSRPTRNGYIQQSLSEA